ncbi:MAG: hypothetical protein EON59_05405 [Alphaproteobacteria bacterium]|nr:MAG: hypothetical protein EON59_05405 [Alphaproteobacteria bacterium]
MAQLAIIDEKEIEITPVFQIREIENIPKSETAGYAVMELHEMVEVRFAGSKNYSPVFPANAFWKREGNREITYAERWPEQYRAFKEGNPQEANGTPLEMLRPFGITPELLSLCRALKIYSIEALHSLQGSNLKSLGIHTNRLKDAARAFMADRAKSSGSFAELEALRERIAELEARSTVPPAEDPKPEEIATAVAAADAAYEGKSDGEIKDMIAALNDGKKPQGQPSRATLISMHRDLVEAA